MKKTAAPAANAAVQTNTVAKAPANTPVKPAVGKAKVTAPAKPAPKVATPPSNQAKPEQKSKAPAAKPAVAVKAVIPETPKESPTVNTAQPAPAPVAEVKSPVNGEAKPVETKAAVNAEAKAAPAKADKKAKKAKVVRDSFTMPEDDYSKIAALKKQCQAAGVPVKKSELLRAGLQALQSMTEAKLLALVSGLENVKTGRPSKH